MHKILLVVALATALSAPAQTTLPDSVTTKLNKAFQALQTKMHVAGLAVAIVKDNDIIYSQGLGFSNLDAKTPVTIDTRFPIMSISKTFTATLLMQMVEKGIVQLHDKVTKYVPEYKVTTADGKPANTTLFQLASHTAGLPRNGPADLGFSESYDRYMLSKGKTALQFTATDEELLKSLPAVRLDYPPYEFIPANSRHYSNLGYSVLGIALKRAARSGFETYLLNNLCRPLKMTSTGFLNEPGIYAQVAKGYRYNNNSYDSFPDYVPNSAIYMGGMYSSAKDLCRYLSFQMSGDDKVLTAESKDMMRTLRIGWKAVYPFAMHEGSYPGYRSMMVFDAEHRFGWVILTNTSDLDFNPVNNFLAEQLNPLVTKSTTPALQQYAGTYSLPQNRGSITITVKNDSLYSTYLQDVLPNAPLVKERGSVFHAAGSNNHTIGYDFMVDEQGNVKALRLGQLTWYKQ